MAYRGYLALDHEEIANSSRVVAHLGTDTPTVDFGFFEGLTDGSYDLVETAPGSGLYVPDEPLGPHVPDFGFPLGPGVVRHPEDPGFFLLHHNPCEPVESIEHPGLFVIDPSSTEVSEGLWTPPQGARILSPGLFVHDQCWGSPTICANCSSAVGYDDSWPGLRAFLSDVEYRPELAPWYSAEIPESGEFGGVWVMDVEGLDGTPVERSVTQTVRSGGVPTPHRDRSRTVKVTALLIACTNAGVEHGLKWVNGLLRSTITDTDTRLRYLTASPAHSAADPETLVRELHNMVLIQEARVEERVNTGGKSNQHGNIYRVSWEMEALSPYAYLPPVEVVVEWDSITRQPVNWVHASDCAKPETCLDMPVMFSTDCRPEEIERISTPPPVCGGCLPVGEIDKYSFRVPTMDYAFRSRETSVSLVVRNTGARSLTLQAFWRFCNTDIRCEDNRFPLQISGLPSGAELHLNGITGRYHAMHDKMRRRPVGVVGTPNGAPWRPALIDREQCWDFVVQTATHSQFEMSMTLTDREP